MRSCITTLALTLLTGCGVINEQSLYEGVRSQQKANNAGKEPKQPTLPTYQQYEKEREELKK
ncbi:MAG: hypothetical protein RI905_672 [Pseudomonadota bacterium]|jgi:hypothetical protein